MAKKQETIKSVMERLAALCRHLTDEQKSKLEKSITLQEYKKNEIIYREGDTPQHLLCLISGKVKVFKDGVGGRSQTMRLYKPVEYFGYRAYISGENIHCTAAAFEHSIIAKIPLPLIFSFVKTNNDLAWFFNNQNEIHFQKSGIEVNDLKIFPFIKLGAEMVVRFSILQSKLVGVYDSWYVEISKDGIEGTETYRYGEGQDYALIDNGDVFLAAFEMIKAKEMGVTYHARMYAEKDGVLYCGPERTGTMKQYLADQLTSTASTATDALRTLAADMLNYGAAAQLYLNYDVEHLVNEELTAAELAALDQYETKGETSAEKSNNNYVPAGETTFLYTYVSMANRVNLGLTINHQNLLQAIPTATEISIQVKTHPEGDSEPELIEVLPTTVNANDSNLLQATFAPTGADTMRTAYDFVVLVDGVERGNIRTWSVEGYLKQVRADTESTAEAKALLNAIVIYGDSVTAYLLEQSN